MSKRPKGNRMANVEDGLGRAIEKPFSRLFRSPLQPAEIEKAALRELERTRKLGVNTIYVANVYTVVISPKDEDTLGDLLDTLEQDLATRLYAYASNNDYQMPTKPLVVFTIDKDTKLGEVYVIGETMSEEAIEEEFGEEALAEVTPRAATPRPERSATPSFTPRPSSLATPPRAPRDAYSEDIAPGGRVIGAGAAGVAGAAAGAAAAAGVSGAREVAPGGRQPLRDPYLQGGVQGEPVQRYQAAPRSSAPEDATTVLPGSALDGTLNPVAGARSCPVMRSLITVNNQPPFVLQGQDAYVIGRNGVCDILIEDPQASRQHAQLVREGDGWVLLDMDSTNGTMLNGVPVAHRRLKDGDVITVGSTTIRYQEAGY